MLGENLEGDPCHEVRQGTHVDRLNNWPFPAFGFSFDHGQGAHAMHEHLGSSQTRDQRLEMAYSSTHWNDGDCVYMCLNCLSIFKITRNEHFFPISNNCCSCTDCRSLFVPKAVMEVW